MIIKGDFFHTNKTGPIQCGNCMKFGHGAENCWMDPKCIRCAVILTRIDNFSEENKILPDEQQGFRTQRSTTRQLTRIMNHTKEQFMNKSSTGLILCDIEKAFDRVWHNGLMFKMIQQNFPIYLINLTKAFQ